MMSSCCTFRLKRRRAFSSDSPSCNLTSANETTPPNRSCVDLLVIARRRVKVKHYIEFLGRCWPSSAALTRASSGGDSRQIKIRAGKVDLSKKRSQNEI